MRWEGELRKPSCGMFGMRQVSEVNAVAVLPHTGGHRDRGAHSPLAPGPRCSLLKHTNALRARLWSQDMTTPFHLPPIPPLPL